MRIQQKESELISSILEYCQYKKIMIWRNQSGMIFIKDKDKTRAVRLGAKGVSDLIGVSKNGRIICCECKVGKGKLTVAQNDFLNEVNLRGGIAMAVFSLEEFIRQVKYEGI